jgi:hypothetical protein
MTTGATIIEIGEIAAGIVVRDGSRHLRFHAASEPFSRLDGRLFRSVRDAVAAAVALLERGPPAPRRPTPEPKRDCTAELMLAAYGPFQTL